MITRPQVEEEIDACIRRACVEPLWSGQWFAVTLWPDGHWEHRTGTGVVSYTEDEYFNRDNSEQTLFVMTAVEDVDPAGDWIDPDTGELDKEAAIDAIVEQEMEQIDWDGIEDMVRQTGQEYSEDERSPASSESSR
jgi:hypothetical protein